MTSRIAARRRRASPNTCDQVSAPYRRQGSTARTRHQARRFAIAGHHDSNRLATFWLITPTARRAQLWRTASSECATLPDRSRSICGVTAGDMPPCQDVAERADDCDTACPRKTDGKAGNVRADAAAAIGFVRDNNIASSQRLAGTKSIQDRPQKIAMELRCCGMRADCARVAVSVEMAVE